MIPLGPVVARSRVGVARAAAWSYLVEPERRAEWWPELRLDARVGGEVAERWSEGEGDDAVSRDASGTVDVWVEGHAVGFTWREAGDERDTAVLVTLRTQGLDTGITVTETGFDALPAPAERAAASQEGWQVLLRDLTAALEAAQAAGVFGERETLSFAAAVAGSGAGAVLEAEGDGDAGEHGAEPEPGAELELVEPEIDGEIDAVGDASPVAEIEVEAEPQVGDHPELETGPIAVVSDDEGETDDADADVVADSESVKSDVALEESDAADTAEVNLDQTIRIDRSELDAALAAGEAEEAGAADTIEDLDTSEAVDAPANDAAENDDEHHDDDSTGDPDFDALIRGD